MSAKTSEISDSEKKLETAWQDLKVVRSEFDGVKAAAEKDKREWQEKADASN